MTKNPFRIAVPYPHQEFGSGRQRKVPSIERRTDIERVLALHWPASTLTPVELQINQLHRHGISPDIAKMRREQRLAEIAERGDNRFYREPTPEPYVEPASGLIVLLIGIVLGVLLAGTACMAAIKWGIL